jgi:hypothetical protein
MAIRTLLLVALRSFNALAQSSAAADAPTATETETPDISEPGDFKASYRLHGYEGCAAYQIDQIKEGYSNMITMVDGTGSVFTTYKPFDWNSAVAQDFWGPAERNRLYRPQIKGKAQKEVLICFTPSVDFESANLDRLAAVTYDFRLNPFARSIHVRCDDPEDFCSPAKCAADGSLVYAYTINHKPHINFCNGYFTRKSLKEVMAKSWASADGYFNKGWCAILLARNHKLMLASLCLGT